MKTDFFPNLFTIAEDNGEVFLSDYFFGQKEREGKRLVGVHSPRCLCEKCGTNPVEISGGPLILEAVPVPQPEPTIPQVAAAIPQLTAPLEPITRYVPAPIAPQPQVPMVMPPLMHPQQQPMAQMFAQMMATMMQQQQPQFAMPVQAAAPVVPAMSQGLVQQRQCCCPKFAHWFAVTRTKGKKAGRPSHDPSCANHASNKKKN